MADEGWGPGRKSRGSESDESQVAGTHWSAAPVLRYPRGGVTKSSDCVTLHGVHSLSPELKAVLNARLGTAGVSTESQKGSRKGGHVWRIFGQTSSSGFRDRWRGVGQQQGTGNMKGEASSTGVSYGFPLPAVLTNLVQRLRVLDFKDGEVLPRRPEPGAHGVAPPVRQLDEPRDAAGGVQRGVQHGLCCRVPPGRTRLGLPGGCHVHRPRPRAPRRRDPSSSMAFSMTRSSSGSPWRPTRSPPSSGANPDVKNTRGSASAAEAAAEGPAPGSTREWPSSS